MTVSSSKPKNNTADSQEKKKSGDKWTGLMVVLVTGFLSALWAASYFGPYSGATTMVVFVSIGYLAAPKKWRRLYRLAIVIAAIAIFLGTFFWEQGIAETVDRLGFAGKVAAFLVNFGLAFFIGFGLVALPVMGGAIYSAPWLEKIGGDVELTQPQLRQHLLRCYLGTNPPYAIVGNGAILGEKPPGVMQSTAGPGIIIVRPETAVVTEWMGSVQQIRGPGKVDVRMFERIKEVLDLRPQWANTGPFTAVTVEGEIVTVQADFRYQIDTNHTNRPASSRKTDPTNKSEGDTPYENHSGHSRSVSENTHTEQNFSNAVYWAVYRSGPNGWKQATERTVRNKITEVINRYEVLRLFNSNRPEGNSNPPTANSTALMEITKAATEQANEITREWGVIVLSVELQDLAAPPVVRSRTQVGVESESSAQRLRVIGQAEAEFARLNDSLRMEVQAASLNNYASTLAGHLGTLSTEERARFLDIIEKVATQVGQDRATALRYIDVLETISQNPNARLIVTTGDGPVTFDSH